MIAKKRMLEPYALEQENNFAELATVAEPLIKEGYKVFENCFDKPSERGRMVKYFSENCELAKLDDRFANYYKLVSIFCDEMNEGLEKTILDQKRDISSLMAVFRELKYGLFRLEHTYSGEVGASFCEMTKEYGLSKYAVSDMTKWCCFDRSAVVGRLSCIYHETDMMEYSSYFDVLMVEIQNEKMA